MTEAQKSEVKDLENSFNGSQSSDSSRDGAIAQGKTILKQSVHPFSISSYSQLFQDLSI